MKIIDENTLALPSYDDNGMNFSMGNMNVNNVISMLFIDFGKLHRARAGRAHS